jgi:RNA polymerase sigma-70 factor (ECF subfamily)
MEKVGLGDGEAFRELVELHQAAVIGTCAKMVGSVDDAHDLAQQVFLRVWKSASRYEPTARFTTWLFTITRNLVFNHTRSASRATFISLDAESDGDDTRPRRDRPDPSAPQPDEAVLKTELWEAIDRAIASLPEAQRMAVVLRRYEDLSYEEIAKIMETSVSSIKSLLFRARGQLREALRDYLEDGH